jgi:mono/diheme cytochrome c family protein
VSVSHVTAQAFGRRDVMLGRRILSRGILILALLLAAEAQARGQESKIWSGVYTPEQAEQGKALFEANCSTCHKSDLSGDRGPALTGNAFFSSWEAGSVNRLYTKIKETMPRNRGTTSLSEDNYVAIVAYILQANAFPPSKNEVELSADVLEDIQIARKGEGRVKGLPNFALVQVIGCLDQGQDKRWRLTSTSQPVLSKDQPATAEELSADVGKPLGTDTFVLQSVVRFKPETNRGRKMEARGLIYKGGNDSLLSLTSLQVVDSACAN